MRRKINIISASYPFGTGETFLENEIKFLSHDFDIEIFPVYYGNSKLDRDVPKNVYFNRPVITKGLIYKLYKSLFVLRFFKIEIVEFFKLIRDGSDFRYNFKIFIIEILNLRLFYSSDSFKKLLNEKNDSITYFYWTNSLVLLTSFFKRTSIVRLHGGEIDLKRYKGYIPFYESKVKVNAFFLPISYFADTELLRLNQNANSAINRLGTYNDNPFSEDNYYSEIISIVSCSNLIPLKRIHLIIEALARCDNQFIQWVHFGDGLLHDQISNLAKSRLNQNVKVEFKGFVKNEEIHNYYKFNHVDLFINVSETEGIPVSLMEAMSYGIPCFATNVGGTSELVNNSNGILVGKNFEIQELSNAIISSKSEEMKRKRKNSYLAWSQSYNAEKNFDELSHLLRLKTQ